MPALARTDVAREDLRCQLAAKCRELLQQLSGPQLESARTWLRVMALRAQHAHPDSRRVAPLLTAANQLPCPDPWAELDAETLCVVRWGLEIALTLPVGGQPPGRIQPILHAAALH